MKAVGLAVSSKDCWRKISIRSLMRFERYRRWCVEKLRFHQSSENVGDRKFPGKSRTSFISHPEAILFSRISREEVF
jgi:hypothetical protein